MIERRSGTITKVCAPCGIAANVLTCLRKFGRSPKHTMNPGSVTYHNGECQVCHDTTSVTEPRDFYYPNFDLLLTAMKRSKTRLLKIEERKDRCPYPGEM